MEPTALDILDRILDEDVLFPLIMGLIGFTAVVFGITSSAIQSVARERTKREIAAYIAEGSMTPEQAERILKAKAPKNC
jgi:hypothetical protein